MYKKNVVYSTGSKSSRWDLPLANENDETDF